MRVVSDWRRPTCRLGSDPHVAAMVDCVVEATLSVSLCPLGGRSGASAEAGAFGARGQPHQKSCWHRAADESQGVVAGEEQNHQYGEFAERESEEVWPRALEKRDLV